MKNKLTGHSRANPDVLKMLTNMTFVKVLFASSKSIQKYNQAMEQFIDGYKASNITMSIGFLFASDFRKMLLELKIDPCHFQCTQLFRQMMPFKTLHYGEITKQIEAQLLKFAVKTSPGLEREYVIIVDCARNLIKN